MLTIKKYAYREMLKRKYWIKNKEIIVLFISRIHKIKCVDLLVEDFPDNEIIYSEIIRLCKLNQKNKLMNQFDLKEIPEYSWENRVKILDEVCSNLTK